MSIIHISFDYPDRIDEKKTKAVLNLINSQNESDNIVFSLNRTAIKINKLKAQIESHGYSLYVFGLPYGIFLYLWMLIAYLRISRIIIRDNLKPTLFHAHKLTFEGIIAFLLSKRFNVPYLLTIRGDSDLKLLYHKPLMRGYYKKITHNSKMNIFLAPWVIEPISQLLGADVVKEKSVLIPNIVSIDKNVHTAEVRMVKRFITVFHFKSYKRKNIKRTLLAFNRVFIRHPEYGLDIVGGGPNKNKILSFIRKSNFPDNINLLGEIENSVLLKMYPQYRGFILPSFPETFGLVFVEALASGVPIIYSKNSGIDGYFDDYQVGIKIDHKSVDEIVGAIHALIERNIEYKKNLNQLILDGYFERFSPTNVGQIYSKIIRQYSLQ